MASAVMRAVVQLLDAQGVTAQQTAFMETAEALAEGIAQLHFKAIPAARLLAPKEPANTDLPPEVTSENRQVLSMASLFTISWLTGNLASGLITGKTATQQACELLCALSDVIYAAYAVVPCPPGMQHASTTSNTAAASSSSSSSSSSSRASQGRRGADFMQLECAGEVVGGSSNARPCEDR
jgi:hypothetical protein